MKRRHFLELNGAAVAAAGLSTVGLQSVALADAPADHVDVGTPVLQNPDIGEISVVWRVHQLSTGFVEYGLTDKLGQSAIAVKHGLCQRDDTALMVHLTGLKPDTTYYYRVVTTPLKYPATGARNLPALGKPHRAAVYQFCTPAIKSDNASFDVINDTHQRTSVIHRLFKRMRADPADAVIWNGDLFNDVYSEKIVTEQTLDMLGPEAYAAQTPLVFVYGNHDVRGENAPDLEKVIPTRQGRRYFTFQNGPVQFMVLDTGEDKPDSSQALRGMTRFERYRSEQQRWIAEQIQRPEWRSAVFRVILCHIPLFGRGSCPDGRNKWHDLLVKGGADLMISGHTHRRAYHGPTEDRPYPLLVGGGPKPDEATIIRGRVKGRQLALSIETLNRKRAGEWTLQARS